MIVVVEVCVGEDDGDQIRFQIVFMSVEECLSVLERVLDVVDAAVPFLLDETQLLSSGSLVGLFTDGELDFSDSPVPVGIVGEVHVWCCICCFCGHCSDPL